MLAAAFVPACAGAVTVSTLAGSGTAGFADGNGPAASFLMPEGLVAAPDGSLIVADTGAQRIRRIDAAGRVTTLAGSGDLDASGLWVNGGYRDGPAGRARFNEPAAVAVAPDGAVIVADAANHCLRRIAGGIVTTYAGNPERPGAADGEARDATFQRPTALAFDAAGTLYVADYGVGVRAISPLGNVSTLSALVRGHAPTVTGIDVVNTYGKPILYIVLGDGIIVTDLDHKSPAIYRAPWADKDSIFVNGFRTIGRPFALSAVAPRWFVVADPRGNAVRYFSNALSAQVAGLALENESFAGGDYRDGDGADVRFDQPMGVAKWTEDRFAVSDTGNRRVRVISGIDFRQNEIAPSNLQAKSAFYRIAYAGNSYVVYNQEWDQSIAGTIEKGLLPSWRDLGLPREPRVLSFEVLGSVEAQAELIRLYLSAHLFEAIVWQFNSVEIDQLFGKTQPFNIATDPQRWSRRVTAIVRGVADEARENGVPLVVAVNPMPYELSPVDDIFGPLAKTPPQDVASYAQVGPLMRAAVAAAGVPVVDLFEPFKAEERTPNPPALFGTLDDHASVAGAKLAGDTILQFLLQHRPWKK